jgi:hypothetical protein
MLAGISWERVQLMGIHAIERTVSQESHLVAVTRNGMRILFNFFSKIVDDPTILDPELLKRPTDQFVIVLKLPTMPNPELTNPIETQIVPTTSDKNTNTTSSLMLSDGTVVTVDGM